MLRDGKCLELDEHWEAEMPLWKGRCYHGKGVSVLSTQSPPEKVLS